MAQKLDPETYARLRATLHDVLGMFRASPVATAAIGKLHAIMVGTEWRGPDAIPKDAPGVWPPGAVDGGTYVVERPESVLNVASIVLPDNFTIVLAPDVERVDWTAGTLQFGVDCTLDVSAPQVELPTPSPALPMAGQAPLWKAGAPGRNGATGAPGRNGVPLRLTIQDHVAQGNLWIRTDGAPGGRGGAGGKGQKGGKKDCSKPPKTKVPPGGKGGDGGTGGRGGDTSDVEIVIASLPANYVFHPQSFDDVPGPSSRPANATGDDGTIVIWGAFGNGGAGGDPGQGGPADGKKVTGCVAGLCTNYSFHPGKKGKNGRTGEEGDDGDGGSAVISQAPVPPDPA